MYDLSSQTHKHLNKVNNFLLLFALIMEEYLPLLLVEANNTNEGVDKTPGSDL